jgi:hypothetical protein
MSIGRNLAKQFWCNCWSTWYSNVPMSSSERLSIPISFSHKTKCFINFLFSSNNFCSEKSVPRNIAPRQDKTSWLEGIHIFKFYSRPKMRKITIGRQALSPTNRDMVFKPVTSAIMKSLSWNQASKTASAVLIDKATGWFATLHQNTRSCGNGDHKFQQTSNSYIGYRPQVQEVTRRWFQSFIKRKVHPNLWGF